jgi:exonuclease III
VKIVTWNCNGAFRKKFHSIMNLDADLFVIQECENPAETRDKDYIEWASNYLWIGSTKNKGLGIFASPNIKLDSLHWRDTYTDHTVKHFLP